MSSIDNIFNYDILNTQIEWGYSVFKGIDVTIVSDCFVGEEQPNVQLLHCGFNEGVKDAVGEYIIFMSTLELNCEDRIDLQLSKIRQSGADACFCGAEVDDGEDFDPSGFVGVIPPATLAVANICLPAVMFKTDLLKQNIADEQIVRDNPYFWIKALRGAQCVPLTEKLVKVRSNIPYNFRECYGTKQQAMHHPLTRYKKEYERVVNSSIYKASKLPQLLTKKLFGDKNKK